MQSQRPHNDVQKACHCRYILQIYNKHGSLSLASDRSAIGPQAEPAHAEEEASQHDGGGLASLLSSAPDFPHVLMGTPREGISHPHTPPHEHDSHDSPASR